MNMHTLIQKGSKLALTVVLALLAFNTAHAQSSSIEWTTVAGMKSAGFSFRSQLSILTDTSEAQEGVNIALHKSTRQSSTAHGGSASRAVDGNTIGQWHNGSVTHSGYHESQPWWFVDLGSVRDITNIRIWNRTDCCSNRLHNFHVFVSNVPFIYNDVARTQTQPGVTDHHFTGTVPRNATIKVNGQGRYIRVQLSSRGALSLAEVEVFEKAHRAVLISEQAPFYGGGVSSSVILSEKEFRAVMAELLLVDWELDTVVATEGICDVPNHEITLLSLSQNIISTCGSPTGDPAAPFNSLKAQSALQQLVDRLRIQ